jgi:hypothetical protein
MCICVSLLLDGLTKSRPTYSLKIFHFCLRHDRHTSRHICSSLVGTPLFVRWSRTGIPSRRRIPLCSKKRRLWPSIRGQIPPLLIYPEE